MSREGLAGVKLTLIPLVFGCAAPDPRPAPVQVDGAATHPWTTSGLVDDARRFADGVAKAPPHTARAAAGPGDVWPATPSPATRYVPSYTGTVSARTRGGALADALADLPPDRAARGVGGLTGEDLFPGTDGVALCEEPSVTFTVPGPGGDWEVALDVPAALWLANGPRRDRYALPEPCVAALLEAGGLTPAVLDDGACAPEDEAAHFATGSDCRACLGQDGDHARCVDLAACPATADRQVYVEARVGRSGWYTALTADALLCAPDHVGRLTVLASGLGPDDPVPGPFAHGVFPGLCVDVWDPVAEAPALNCTLSAFDGHTVSDVLVAEVAHLGPPGGTRGTYDHRLALLDDLEVDGRTWTGVFLFEANLGPVSQPLGTGYAWGLPPPRPPLRRHRPRRPRPPARPGLARRRLPQDRVQPAGRPGRRLQRQPLRRGRVAGPR